MEEKSLLLSKGRVTYLEHGSGPTVLFLHGGLATPRGYIPLIESLGDSYHIIAPTHPGHGDSFPLPNDWVFSAYADVYAELFDAIAISKPITVSHSLGGAIGLLLASKALIGSMVTFAPMGLPISTTPSMYVATLSKEAKTMLLGIKKRQQLKELLTATGSILYSTMKHPENISWLQEYGPGIDLSEVLPSIPTQIELFWGADDVIVPLSIGRAMRELLPHSSLAVLPSKGHTYIATDPLYTYGKLKPILDSFVGA